MNKKLPRLAIVWTIPVIVGIAAALVCHPYLAESIAAQAQRQAKRVPPVRFTAMNISLPAGGAAFPPGPGADIANAQCVMCHSTSMVMKQPPLSADEWKMIILKMRTSFGAPIPLEQVNQLADYFKLINGRERGTEPAVVDHQAS